MSREPQTMTLLPEEVLIISECHPATYRPEWTKEWKRATQEQKTPLSCFFAPEVIDGCLGQCHEAVDEV